MNELLKVMLGKYSPKSTLDYENAIKEVIQEIALLGLWRSKFFEIAALYGGTALRLLYSLNRFSEDLDFSLLKPDITFRPAKYLKAVETEMQSLGKNVSVQYKQKVKRSNIESAIIKIFPDLSNFTGSNKILKVRLDIDTDPPSGFETETRYLYNPIPFSVNAYKACDIFAGKTHAVLCRKWEKRVKGRDWYDFVWFIAKGIPLNVRHLEKRLQQTGHLGRNEQLFKENLIDMLNQRIDELDIEAARKDISPFIIDQDAVKVWSRHFFRDIISGIKAIT